MRSVNSRELETAAATIRRWRHGPQKIPLENVTVSAAQLDKAAQLLRDAEPSIIRSRGRSAEVDERPGFIDARDQDKDNPEVFTFRVGILPSVIYRIDRKGQIQSEARA